MNFRQERVGNLIREELSKLIERELEFDGALVTLTEVKIDKKMDSARVGVTVWPSEKLESSLKILKRSQGELQFRLNRILNIKPMPRLYFDADYGPENAARVEKKLMEEIEKDNKAQ